MLLLILATVAATFLFYYFIVKPFHYWKDKGVKQGSTTWIFGDNFGTFWKRQSFAEMVEMIYNGFPEARYVGMYQFFTPILMLRDLELIKQITVKDFDHFTDHSNLFPEDADALWANNLFALRGQRWRDMRSILSPSFTSSKMRAMFVLMSECAENFTQHFLKRNEEVVTVEFKDIFTRFTNDVIATTAFGIKVDSLGQPRNEFYLMGNKATDFSNFWQNLKIFACMFLPRISNMLNLTLFPKQVRNFFIGLVKDTIRIRQEKGIVRPDMINLLMEARKGGGFNKQEEKGVIDTGFSTAQKSELVKSKLPTELSDLDIASQAMIFFLAGFDTVSGVMSFLAYELASNPDIQDKLREEVRSTLRECKGDLTYESLLKMKYMDMVVSESLRKWPNVASVDRVCTKPYTIQPVTPDEKPVHFEKGEMVWLPIYAMHHDPKHYPNPERFDPERFNDENKANIKPYTYFPFGLGPRNCIGSRFGLLEIKTIMFYIIKHFELVPVEKTTIPVMISRKQFTLNAQEGFWFGLKRVKA